MSSAILAAGLEYLRRGIPLIRLQPGTKTPYRGSNGYLDRTSDEATVRSWFEHDEPNLGWCPWDDRCVALDLDTYHVHDSDTCERVRAAADRIIATPSGGEHCLFRVDRAYANGTLATGIDVRGAHGYILIEGCTIDHRSGQPLDRWGTYEVAKDGRPGPLPEWVVARLNEAHERKREPIPAELLASLDQEINVERAGTWLTAADPTLPGYTIACKLLDFGLSPDKAGELFSAWSDTLPWAWDHEDIERKIANAWHYRQNRGDAPLAMDGRPSDEIFAKPHINEDTPKRRFALVRPSSGPGLTEIEFWDEHNTMPKRQTIVTYGDWGSHKTNIKLAQTLRSGARVVYAVGEGAHGVLKARIPAQAAAIGLDLAELDERFAVVRSVPMLTSPADVAEFIATIADFRPEIVVIDTLATATAGSDENSAVWSALLTANGPVGRIQRELGCTVDLIAHSGKDQGRGVRGHSGALGNADVGLLCRRRSDDYVELFVDKMRDGPDKRRVWWQITTGEGGVPVPVPCKVAPPLPANELLAQIVAICDERKLHSWEFGLSHELMAQLTLSADNGRPDYEDCLKAEKSRLQKLSGGGECARLGAKKGREWRWFSPQREA